MYRALCAAVSFIATVLAPSAKATEVAAPPQGHSATAAPNSTIEAALSVARGYINTPWRWDGRDTTRNPQLDCLGLLFRSYGKATGTPWTSYPVNPSELVASGKLGTPVEGVEGALRANLDRARLQRGDILYFLVEGYEIPDKPLLVIGERRFWPWHVGIYMGEGIALNTHPTEGTKEMLLDEITWDALYATRLKP